jgi:hypothetical protein
MGASIFMALMIGIYSAFRTGIFSYARIDESLSLTQEAAQIFHRIDLDLRNSFFFSSDSSEFMGSAANMSFLTQAQWSENASIESRLTRVSYVWQDRTLTRLIRRDKDSLNEKSESTLEEMASNIESCVFSYSALSSGGSSTLIWKNLWENSTTMPQAVKIKLKVKEKEAVEFERIVYLSAATVVK